VSKRKKGTRTFGGGRGGKVDVLKDFSGTRTRRSRDPSEKKEWQMCRGNGNLQLGDWENHGYHHSIIFKPNLDLHSKSI